MKMYLKLIPVVLFLLGNTNAHTQTIRTKKTIHRKIAMAHPIRPARPQTEDIPLPRTIGATSHLIEWSDVNKMARQYIGDHSVISAAPRYFIFETNLLKDYLRPILSRHNDYMMHFLLLEDEAKTTLDIAMVADDSYGNEEYIKTGGKFFTLGKCLTRIDPFETTLEDPMESDIRSDESFMQEMRKEKAAGIIQKYSDDVTNGNKIESSSSYLFNARDLYRFILSTPEMKYIQIFLGDDNGRLIMMITGLYIDADPTKNRHIYFYDHRVNPCILEHVLPCPTCNLFSDGIQVQDPAMRN